MDTPAAPDGAGHDHDHGHEHGHAGGVRGFVASLFRPHSHDHAESVDDTLLASRDGTRTLAVSLVGLLVTAALQAVVAWFSGSVGLLADTIHNGADALTALPLGLAFVMGRRPPTRRYTYGFGRAEDLAGLAVVGVIAVSVVVAAGEAVDRLIHPHPITHLWWVVAAGLIGFAGNEIVARYRIRTGRRIGSAALVADGLHARTDGFTSLAVVVAAGGQAAGLRLADPIIGLLISVAIASVLRGAARNVYRRLMDAVDPDLVDRAEQVTRGVPGVLEAQEIRIRWIGHELLAELDVTVERQLTVGEAHDIAESVQHALLHQLPRLSAVTVHVDPSPVDGAVDPHHLTSSHRRRRA